MALDVDVVEVIVTQPVDVDQVGVAVIEVVPEAEVIEVLTSQIVVVEVQAPTVTEVVVAVPGPPGPPGPAGPGGGEEMASYQKEVDFVGSDVIYKGEAAPGSVGTAPVWRIKKIQFVGEDISEKWANGTAAFDKVWVDRATYTY